MPPYRHRLLTLPPNRVWRSYRGGRQLDAIAGVVPPADGHFPEDWIASLTPAANPVPTSADEGLATVEVDGRRHRLRDLVVADPEYFLGSAHVARFGADPRLLVKFIDSAIRLHFQVHPTTDFARRVLGASAGKTEAYHVLGVRPEHDGLLYLGFQRPPSRDRLRDLIERQDIAGLKACFDPIRVHPGDTYLVPAGTPHALGAGLLVVEVQEPSDLVVRFEFARGGYVLPESARFMNRGLEFCLDIFDLTPRALTAEDDPFRCQPRRRHTWSSRSWEDELIGPARTPCFRLSKLHLSEPVEITPECFTLAIVTAGACEVTAAIGSAYPFGAYEKFLLPAGLGPVRIEPAPDVEILLCQPPGEFKL